MTQETYNLHDWLNCPECGSDEVRSKGRADDGTLGVECEDCGQWDWI